MNSSIIKSMQTVRIILIKLIVEKGGLIDAIETVRDITNIKEIEAKLFYLSSHDSLTGLVVYF